MKKSKIISIVFLVLFIIAFLIAAGINAFGMIAIIAKNGLLDGWEMIRDMQNPFNFLNINFFVTLAMFLPAFIFFILYETFKD